MSSLEKAKELLAIFKKQNEYQFKNLAQRSESLFSVCGQIQRSWSGSFAGWHGRMYFRDFKTPSVYELFNGEWGGLHEIPDGWEERQNEEVVEKIDELMGENFSVEEYENEIKRMRETLETLKRETSIAFSSFEFSTQTEKEKEILTKIESFLFEPILQKYIETVMPKTMMTRDSEALRQGSLLPSWLYYKGVAKDGENICRQAKDFLLLLDRLIRQLEMKIPRQTGKINSENGLKNLHKEIYQKCNELYREGTYSEAVEKSFKVVRDRLRKLTGYEKGSEAFGKGRLHINCGSREKRRQVASR